MTRSMLRGLLLLTLTATAAACAAPVPLGSYSNGRQKAKVADDDADDDDDDDERQQQRTKPTAHTPEGETAPTPVTAPRLRASYRGADGIKAGDFQLGRICTDAGAEQSRATFVDGTALYLVPVSDGRTVVARLEGEELAAMKKVMTSGDATGGRFEMTVDPSKLPTKPTEFAMIMTGDNRFGSPAKCNYQLRPGDDEERRAKLFPEDCGIVAFVEAYWDAAKKEVVARATSQFLLAADNEGRAGFSRGDHYPGCDGHSSPLVLDLGGRGVTLGAPVADRFDIDGDGKRDEISWVTSDDTPYLVRDGNGNGLVDDVDEMFGNRTRPALGGRPSMDGFEALAAWDKDALGGSADGVVDEHDAVWSTLRLWFDRNHDGRTDPGELETLEAHGVRSLGLGYVQVRHELSAAGKKQGAIRQRGAATLRDGNVVPMMDVWFEKDL